MVAAQNRLDVHILNLAWSSPCSIASAKIRRVGALGGEGHALTGHHEIMIPQLAGLVLAELQAAS